MSDNNWQFPAWFIGLLIAIVLLALAVFVFDFFGFGDDPALGARVGAWLV
jgi:hypothetical protein